MKPLSIYIHIPFCEKKCYYCDFLSFNSNEQDILKYHKALLHEITSFISKNKDKYIIKTIFIGGGTPSMLPVGYIGEIMDTIYHSFNVDKYAEITIEANPGLLSYKKIKHFKSSHINRISIGVQAYQNRLLKKIGRIHSIEQFMHNYELVKSVGFNNINVDIMFSLPTQTKDEFYETLTQIAKLSPTHISVYSLILEENTKFYEMYKNGLFSPTNDELDREFYYMALDVLSKNSYKSYEISNFSKLNMECQHNIVYWQRKEYVGFGLGASSLLNEKRIINTQDFNAYISLVNKQEVEVLTPRHMYSEFMFLGLRMTRGIKKSDFYKAFNHDIMDIYGDEIKKFINHSLIIENGDILSLSQRGFDVSNTIFLDFI